MFDEPVQEVLKRINSRQEEAERQRRLNEGEEPRNALNFLQAVYRDQEVPLHTRMRAAMASLPFESPKLIAQTVLSNEAFSTLLDKAILRSQGVYAKVINGQATEGD